MKLSMNQIILLMLVSTFLTLAAVAISEFRDQRRRRARRR